MNEMKSNKDLINLVRKFIRALKVQYDVIRLFEIMARPTPRILSVQFRTLRALHGKKL